MPTPPTPTLPEHRAAWPRQAQAEPRRRRPAVVDDGHEPEAHPFADAAHAARVAAVIKALGHPTRLRIVTLLCEGEEFVGRMAERLGVAQAIVSQQLRILRLHGLVEVTRHDGHAYYRLVESRLPDFLGCLSELARR